MNNLFKPEDFYVYTKEMTQGADPLSPSQRLAFVANAKLNALIESWPVYYISRGMDELSPIIKDEKNHILISSNFKNSYYTARLAFIEPIVAEPCKHESKSFGYKNCEPMANCDLCGVELAATWGEVVK